METSKEEKDFADLKMVVSEWFDKNIDINMLKVLYSDHVGDTFALHVASKTMDLINMLISFGNLSPTDLALLYDTIKATQQFGLEQEIKKQVPSFHFPKDTWDNVFTEFTPYRLRLVQLGMSLIPRDVERLSQHYDVKHTNSWSLIMELEYKMIICEENINDFTKTLKKLKLQRAVKALTEDISSVLLTFRKRHREGLKVTVKRKIDSSNLDDQPNSKYFVHLLTELHKYKKDIAASKDISKEISAPLLKKSVLLFQKLAVILDEVEEGSVVFHLSTHDPDALMNLWEVHSCGKLIRDLARILVPEKHQQEFLDEWMTCIDENEYKAALKKLKEEDIPKPSSYSGQASETQKSETSDLPSPATLEVKPERLPTDEHKRQLVGSSETIMETQKSDMPDVPSIMTFKGSSEKKLSSDEIKAQLEGTSETITEIQKSDMPDVPSTMSLEGTYEELSSVEYKAQLVRPSEKETESETHDVPSSATFEDTSEQLSSDEHKTLLVGSSEKTQKSETSDLQSPVTIEVKPEKLPTDEQKRQLVGSSETIMETQKSDMPDVPSIMTFKESSEKLSSDEIKTQLEGTSKTSEGILEDSEDSDKEHETQLVKPKMETQKSETSDLQSPATIEVKPEKLPTDEHKTQQVGSSEKTQKSETSDLPSLATIEVKPEELPTDEHKRQLAGSSETITEIQKSDMPDVPSTMSLEGTSEELSSEASEGILEDSGDSDKEHETQLVIPKMVQGHILKEAVGAAAPPLYTV
ncbi:uncharacterized protein LOC117120316 [Anneissia japonica]|uniref:uncharacterized protein LOC117120316 n=1 Tax=Anneissia japonica TaxID=1529436 RepID=UPI001425B20A|nr:uncharacterized protein LOC117120316 [Anneissia japonica]